MLFSEKPVLRQKGPNCWMMKTGLSSFPCSIWVCSFCSHGKCNSCSWGGNKDKSPGVLWHFPSSSFRGQHLALDINSPGSFEGRKCCMLITQRRTNCCSTLNELWVVQGIFFRPWLIFPLAPLGLSNFVFSNTKIFPCWRFRWGTVLQCSSSIVFSSAVNQQLQDVGNCGRDFW